jgi:hypothetical protein
MSCLLLAPAGHGKTQFVIEQIRATLASEPLSPIIVIVPNSIKAAGFRQRLCASGGTLGVDVHTFRTLYAELLTRVGQPIPLLTDPVRIRLPRAIVDELCERGEGVPASSPTLSRSDPDPQVGSLTVVAALVCAS